MRSLKSKGLVLILCLILAASIATAATQTPNAPIPTVKFLIGEPFIPPKLLAIKTIQLKIEKASDITVTYYDASGNPTTISEQFDYDPEEAIENNLQTAGFTVNKEDSDAAGDATLMVNYQERKRGMGLDAPTAYYFSFTLYDAAGVKLFEDGAKSTGCDSVAELRNDPKFKNIGDDINEGCTKRTKMLSQLISPRTITVKLSKPLINWTKGLLFKIPDGLTGAQFFTLSPNRRIVAYLAVKNNQNVLMINDQAVDAYDIFHDRPVFHPDGTTLGYTYEKNGAYFIGMDGQTGYSPAEAFGLTFSPGGKQYAYLIRDNDQSRAVINGQKGEKFADIFSEVMFSNNGDTVFWAKNDDKYLLVLNGVKQETDWEEVTVPTFTTGGKVAFAGEKEGKWYLVVDGKAELLNIDGEIQAGPYFSANGKSAAYVVQKDADNFVEFNNAELGKYVGQIGIPYLSDDGTKVAFVVTVDKQDFVVVNQSESPKYDQVLGPVLFSADGKTISFGEQQGQELSLEVMKISDLTKRILLINTLTGHTDQVSALAITPDGKRLISGSMDNTIKVWEPATGQEPTTLTGHTGFVDTLAVTPDGNGCYRGQVMPQLRSGIWRRGQNFPL